VRAETPDERFFEPAKHRLAEENELFYGLIMIGRSRFIELIPARADHLPPTSQGRLMIFNQQLRPDSFVMQLSTRSEFIVARFLSFRENQSWLERMKSSFSSFAARRKG
jgi:hypothetical protein